MKRTLLSVIWLGLACAALAGEARTRNVILVTIDGLRWQEVFRGADWSYATPEAGNVSGKALVGLTEKFDGPTPGERRARLMPFLWTEVVQRGVILGNRDRGSEARVTNTAHVSYPGYNEMLTGRPDPGITNNALVPNPNVTVLEWLNHRPSFTGKVMAITTWQVFPAIYNRERSGLPQWVSGQHSPAGSVSAELADIERWMDDIPSKSADEHYDAFAYRAALEFIGTKRPRVLHLALGEPDTWAHSRRYYNYLVSTQNCDRFIRLLWEKLQSMPEYRGTTTLIISPDHGRGATPDDWIHHSSKIPHADETWLAVLGPDTPAAGEGSSGTKATQAQIAATIAALLGEDFRAEYPQAAEPLAIATGAVPR